MCILIKTLYNIYIKIKFGLNSEKAKIAPFWKKIWIELKIINENWDWIEYKALTRDTDTNIWH